MRQLDLVTQVDRLAPAIRETMRNTPCEGQYTLVFFELRGWYLRPRLLLIRARWKTAELLPVEEVYPARCAAARRKRICG